MNKNFITALNEFSKSIVVSMINRDLFNAAVIDRNEFVLEYFLNMTAQGYMNPFCMNLKIMELKIKKGKI